MSAEISLNNTSVNIANDFDMISSPSKLNMNDALRQILDNKDQIVKSLQDQIIKQKRIMESTLTTRQANEKDLTSKARENEGTKKKVIQQRLLLESKRKDPSKQAKIQSLLNQNQDMASKYEQRLLDLEAKRKDYYKVQEVKIGLENQKLINQQSLEKHQLDLEDKEYMEGKIQQSQAQINVLSEQQAKLIKQINNRQQSKVVDSQTEGVDKLIQNMVRVNQFERQANLTYDWMLQSHKALQKLIEEYERLQGYAVSQSHRLYITLGQSKPQSISTMYFILKQFLLENKASQMRKNLSLDLSQLQKQISSLTEYQQSLQQKDIDSITDTFLELGSQINRECNNWKAVCFNNINEGQNFSKTLDKQIQQFIDNLKSRCALEVQNRLAIIEKDNNQGTDRIKRVTDTLYKFDKELARLLMIGRLRYRKDDFQDLSKLVQEFQQEGYELSANYHIMNTVIIKSKSYLKNVDAFGLQQIERIIKQFSEYERSILRDEYCLYQLEQKVKDLQINFNNLIRLISQETQDHLNNQINERTRQAEEIQKKDRELQSLIEGRKSELFNIKKQINDTDSELQNMFSTNEQNLFEAGGDEEQVSQQHRQLLNRTSNIMQQFKQIETDDFNAFDKAHGLFEQLDEMDSFIFETEQKIQEGFQKANQFEVNFKDLEKRLKNQRINECESVLKITFDTVEELKKHIDKLTTQVSIIQRDQQQLLNNDGFQDQEKRKEIASFSQELENKQRQLQAFIDTKDQLNLQIELLEKDFQQKMREKGGSSRDINANAGNSKDGCEFQNIKNNTEKIKEQIQRQIQAIEGEMNDDIQICREVNVKMIKKYKNKKDVYQKSIDIRSQKLDDFKDYQVKLDVLKNRKSLLSQNLLNLALQKSDPNFDQLQQLVQKLKNNQQNSQEVEQQIGQYTQKLRNQASDLDSVDTKIIKSARLDDIYKLLQEIKITSEPMDDNLDKQDYQLKQIEKEIEAFMIKTRSSQIFESDSSIKNLQNSLQRLINKIHEVNTELTSFNDIMKEGTLNIENINQIHKEIDKFFQDMGVIEVTKDNFVGQLELLQSKFALLDQKNLQITECASIVKDAQHVENLSNQEFQNVVDIQNRLHQLMKRFKDQSQFENDRQKLIEIAKQKLHNNQNLYKKMQVLLQQNTEKIGDFDTVYKSMISSEDFNSKKPLIEKKIRRMSQFKIDCSKYQEDSEKLMQELTGPLSISEVDIDKMTDLSQLQKLIDDNEKQNQLLQIDVKELSDLETKFEVKRQKIADAEVRKLSNQRVQELEKVRDNLLVQMNKLNDFERQLIERQIDNTQDPMSPEKQGQLTKTLTEMKEQFQEFKAQFDQVDEDIRNINIELASKNLEQDVSLPQLAKEIDRLRKKTFEVKELNLELDKIQIELQAKSTMLSSLDTEKRLKNLLIDISRAQENDDQVKESLQRIQEISRSYDGYTSGAEDEEFFTVMHSESRDLLSDFNLCQNTFQDYQSDIANLQQLIEQKKEQSGGNLRSEDVDQINEQIARLEVKVGKVQKQREELEQVASANKNRMAYHDVEMKLNRRKQEVEELDKIIADINTDNQSISERILAEIESCQGDNKYNAYIEKLKTILQSTQMIEEKASEIHKRKTDIDYEVDQVINDLGNNSHDVNQRMTSLDSNLILKKEIQSTLKQISNLHSLVKQVFSQTNDAFLRKPQEPLFKPPPGADEVDKMLAEILNRLGLNIPIKKLGGGYYMFGTKKIFCKIINGKLVVRVGGGYMGIEEFCVQYGQAELEKVNAQALIEAKIKEQSDGHSAKGGLHSKTSANNMASMKDLPTNQPAVHSQPQSSLSLKLALSKGITLKEKGMAGGGTGTAAGAGTFQQLGQSPMTNRSEVEDNVSVGMGSINGSVTNQSFTKIGASAKANYTQLSDKGGISTIKDGTSDNSKKPIKKSGTMMGNKK